MILQNIEQFVVQDDENQTAYLKLPDDNYWWYWYGSEIEANAYYLKLLAQDRPQGREGRRGWSSTCSTTASTPPTGTARATRPSASRRWPTTSRPAARTEPDMTVEVWLDGKKQKEVKINAENLFTFDNKFVLAGDDVKDGKHTSRSRSKGNGPVYFNAYLTNFTLEDFITKAGLEVKVEPQVLQARAGRQDDQGRRLSAARPLDQKVEKYERERAGEPGDTLKSGDLVEIELEIDSKNDYEYLIFEDMKAAGFEPVDVRSGYNGNELGAYMELRDDRVALLRPRAGPRQALRQLPHAGRDPRQVQRPADAGLRHVRPGAEGQLGRDQAEDRGLIRGAGFQPAPSTRRSTPHASPRCCDCGRFAGSPRTPTPESLPSLHLPSAAKAPPSDRRRGG